MIEFILDMLFYTVLLLVGIPFLIYLYTRVFVSGILGAFFDYILKLNKNEEEKEK